MKLATLIPMGHAEIENACRGMANFALVKVPSPAELGASIADAEGFVIGATGYTADVAAALRQNAKKLRWIQFASAGYDTAFQHGVPPGVTVTNSGPAWAAVVAEHALALMLGLVRRVYQAERDRAKGEWSRPAMLRASGSLEGMRLVVLGFGNIGREAALRARAFGMKVTGIARGARHEDLAEQIVAADQLRAWLPQADVLLIAAPLNAGTRGLIGAAELALMKPTALVVNVARGEIVSETALAEALAAGRLAGAGIDVFDTEPLPKDHPFWGLGNVILTPHTAGFGSTAGFGRMAGIVADNARRLIAGKPLVHVIDMAAK